MPDPQVLYVVTAVVVLALIAWVVAVLTRTGDAVDATIQLASHRGVLIPTDAIVEDPQTGRAIVFVRARGKDGAETFVSREISTGAADGATTMVTSGLRAGERIASRGAFDLLAPSG